MVLLVVLLSLSLFALGYYLGNQLGSTAHVHERLRLARENNLTTRIDR